VMDLGCGNYLGGQDSFPFSCFQFQLDAHFFRVCRELARGLGRRGGENTEGATGEH
jgi:hypothetical protein